MARRRKMGAMSTGTVLALAGGGVLVLYLIMKNKTPAPMPTMLPGGVGPTAASLQAQASTTNTEVTQGASIVNNLINSIFQ